MTTLIETVRARLVGAGYTGIVTVEPYGDRDTDFTVTFDRHLDADTLASIEATEGFELLSPVEAGAIVRIPVEWLDEADDTRAPNAQLNTTSESTVHTETTVDPIIQRITDELTRLGNNIVGAHISVYGRGKGCPSGDCYAVTFNDESDIVTFEGHKFTSLFRSGNRFVVVGIPAEWKQADPTPAADLDLSETDAWVKSVNDAARAADAEFAEAMDISPIVHLAADDPDVQKATNKFVKIASGGKYKNTDEVFETGVEPALDVTATLIKRLQRRVAELAEDKQRLEQRVESLVDERDELIEQRDSAIAMAAVASDLEAERFEAAAEGRLVLNPCKEVVTLYHLVGRPDDRKKADAELAQYLNDRWEKFDCAVVAGEMTLRVITLVRQQPALMPNPLHAARQMIEPIPGTHTVYPPVPQFNIPAYDMPLGLNRDERVEHRVEQIKAVAQEFIRAYVSGEQS